MTSHVLYRMFNATDDLLYVGLTNNPKGRIGNHAVKDWWISVAYIRLEHFATRDELKAAETKAIREERPLFNATFTPFTARWCQSEGHGAPRGRRCEDCDDAYHAFLHEREEADSDVGLAHTLRDDPVTRSVLGIDPPAGQSNLTHEEVRATPQWKRFEQLCNSILGPRDV